ncbi:MAG: cyclodeaminase/cyclohydrolase family protein [Candidatus Omnitrophica bacterium]|nr:cyclodeaminase/cyclohydrolase family protein [Candidatus Omnitrophota bacterium]MDD5770801.1 cyclodeaminase/cyclohydrolase family protein [Candidatus Omnitrophota bacterium]
MEYKNQNLSKYLDDLSARVSAPGGGSAAALTAAMGAGLIAMMVNFTLGKPGYGAFEAELKKTLAKSERLRNDFLDLVDLDVVAYRSRDMRKALDVPLMLARLCCEAAKLCPPLLKKGNPNLITDLAIAAIFFEAAFISACFNVEINLKSLNDKRLARGIRKEIGQNTKTIQKIRKNTEAQVGKIIRG